MKKILIVSIIAGLLVGGVVLAANTFPETLNVWEYGDLIEQDWANQLEIKIGIDNSQRRSF